MRHIVTLIAIFITFILTIPANYYSGKNLLIHDNYYWLFPAFKYWYDSISINQFPYFDFFSNNGVPFHQLIVQLRFLDPIDLIITKFLSSIKLDMASAFNIRYLILNIINSFFTYLFISKYLNNNISKYLLLILLLFSSFILCTFRQPGHLLVYQWTGLILFCIHNIFDKNKKTDKKSNIVNYIIGGFFISNTLWGYSYSGLAILLLCFLIVHYKNLTIKYNNKIFLVFLCVIPALPTLAVYFDRNSLIYPPREITEINQINDIKYVYSQYEIKNIEEIKKNKNNLVQNYKVLEDTATFGKPLDFITLFSPSYNGAIVNDINNLNDVSECYYYYGLLMIFFFPIGFIFFIKHFTKLSYVFILMLLFYLGPEFYFHKIVYSIFPPMWVFRHTILITLFIQTFLILFCCKGFDILYDYSNQKLDLSVFNPIKLEKYFIYSIAILFIFALVLSCLIDKFKIDIYFIFAVLYVFMIHIVFKIKKYIYLNKVLLIGVVFLTLLQLISEFNKSTKLFSDEIDITYTYFNRPSDQSKIINNLIIQPADLHPGCYYGNTYQVIRYPALLNYQRSLFSTPVAVDSDFASKKIHCNNFNILNNNFYNLNRWNVMVLYKSYFYDIITLKEKFYDVRKFLIIDPIYRKKVTSINPNSITFSDTDIGVIETNLYFDFNWHVQCDEASFSTVNNSNLLKIDMYKKCNKLTLIYSPDLFIYSLYLLFTYYICFIIFLFLEVFKQIKSNFFINHFENPN